MRPRLKFACALLSLFTFSSLTAGQTDSPKSTYEQLSWKEYIYPKDGFAITLPHAPLVEHLQQSTKYTVVPAHDILVSLYVSVEPKDCSAWVTGARDLANQRPAPAAKPLTKEVTIKGHPAFVKVMRQQSFLQYELQECLGNKTYYFHAHWFWGRPEPEEVSRILNSFRLLTEEGKP